METVYDRLVAAGAPALPSAMSYRITHDDTLGDLVLDVVAHKRRGKVELVSRRRVDASTLPVDAIEGALASAAMEAWGEVRATLTRQTATEQLLGTHGPEGSAAVKKTEGEA